MSGYYSFAIGDFPDLQSFVTEECGEEYLLISRFNDPNCVIHGNFTLSLHQCSVVQVFKAALSSTIQTAAYLLCSLSILYYSVHVVCGFIYNTYHVLCQLLEHP